MCLSRVLVPQRVPHPGSAGFCGGLGCMSRAVVMFSGERGALSLDSPSRHLDSALELLEHVAGTQLLATVHHHQLRTVIDRRSNSEGGRRAVVSSRPETGVSEAYASGGAASLTSVCPAQGGEATLSVKLI
jgi:hypothetical protein